MSDVTPTTTINTAAATVKFSLTMTIEGTSLHEIDDALAREAAKRLVARLNVPPTIAGNVLTPQGINEMGKQPQQPQQPIQPIQGEKHEKRSKASAGQNAGQNESKEKTDRKVKEEIVKRAAASDPTDTNSALAPVAEAAAESPPTSQTFAEPESSIPSEGECRAAVIELCKMPGGVEKAAECFKSVGAQGFPSLKEKKRSDFLAAVKIALK